MRGRSGIINAIRSRLLGILQSVRAGLDPSAVVPVRQNGTAIQAAKEGLGSIRGVLYNYTTVTDEKIREVGAVARAKTRRPIRPSETIHNDASSAAVFFVVIILMIVVGLALFTALSSVFPGAAS